MKRRFFPVEEVPISKEISYCICEIPLTINKHWFDYIISDKVNWCICVPGAMSITYESYYHKILTKYDMRNLAFWKACISAALLSKRLPNLKAVLVSRFGKYYDKTSNGVSIERGRPYSNVRHSRDQNEIKKKSLCRSGFHSPIIVYVGKFIQDTFPYYFPLKIVLKASFRTIKLLTRVIRKAV